jgi:ArsR family transcriptional regulator, arsenate/arsenite/antimonite-responsive transcriptional repressor
MTTTGGSLIPGPPIGERRWIENARCIDICQCDWQDGAVTILLPVIQPDADACCATVTGGALDGEQAEQIARTFKALGDPTRVKLLSLIAAADGAEACICDLTAPVGLSQPTVSHHMKQLVEAGLATREQRGKWAFYRVVDGALENAARSLLPA